MNKHIIVFVLLSCFAVGIFAADGEYTPPKDGEIVLVLKLVMNPAPNDEFFNGYWGLSSDHMQFKPKRADRDKQQPTDAKLVIKGNVFEIRDQDLGQLGNTVTLRVSTNFAKEIDLDYFRVNLASIAGLKVYLPIEGKFTLPENDQYIYLGTFYYQWENNTFDIIEARRIDEYDEAQAIVKERYGNDARLIRAVLKEQE